MTLTETMMSVFAFSAILIGVAFFAKNVLSFNKYADNSLQTVSDSRAIIQKMVRELRAASSGNDGSYVIAQAATSTITFYSDTNDDGLKERIRYFLSGTSLRRGSVTPSGSPPTYNLGSEVLSTVVSNVRNGTSTPVFQYFGGTYAGSGAPLSYPLSITSIRLIKIDLLIDKDTMRLPLPRLFSSQVMLRNTKDNL